jgi:hypothetical protein
MHAEIELGVAARPRRRLGEPGTRHHDAPARGRPVLQSLEAALVGGVAHAEVIHVDDGDSIVCMEAQSF